MSKIIKLKDDYKSAPNYLNQQKVNIEKLEEIENDLKELAFNTATAGKWKEWSDGFKEGDTFQLKDEMLKETGDDNVTLITSLTDEVIRVKAKLKNILS